MLLGHCVHNNSGNNLGDWWYEVLLGHCMHNNTSNKLVDCHNEDHSESSYEIGSSKNHINELWECTGWRREHNVDIRTGIRKIVQKQENKSNSSQTYPGVVPQWPKLRRGCGAVFRHVINMGGIQNCIQISKRKLLTFNRQYDRHRKRNGDTKHLQYILVQNVSLARDELYEGYFKGGQVNHKLHGNFLSWLLFLMFALLQPSSKCTNDLIRRFVRSNNVWPMSILFTICCDSCFYITGMFCLI